MKSNDIVDIVDIVHCQSTSELIDTLANCMFIFVS